MSQKRRERQYPLDRPPDGMVVEPELPNNNPMQTSQTSIDNSLAGADENLPPVTDAQGNPLPLTEFGGMEDYADESVPPEVRQAAVNIPETGTLFNLAPFEQIAQLHAAGQIDEARKVYNSLNDQAKYVYNNARNMERFTAQEGARLANEYRELEDRKRSAQERLAEKRLSTMEQSSAEDAQKTLQRADNMLFLLDNLRGGERGKVSEKSEKWRSRVGRVQGGWPEWASSGEDLGWIADFNSLKGAINLTEAQGNKGQGPLSDGERVLMAQAASLGLERKRDEEGFQKAFERMYDMALDAKNNSMKKIKGGGDAAPSPAPQKERRIVGGVSYVRGSDGLLYPE